jgi:hypothetical protein
MQKSRQSQKSLKTVGRAKGRGFTAGCRLPRTLEGTEVKAEIRRWQRSKSALCGRSGCGLIVVFATKVNPFLLRRSMKDPIRRTVNPVAGRVFL